MELTEALDANDWDAVAAALPQLGPMALIDALSEATSGDVEAAHPVGLWHVAAVRFNALRAEGAAPVPSEALGDAAALRDALKQRAEAGSLSIHRASRQLSDPGFFLVREDGSFLGVAAEGDEVTLEGEQGAGRTVRLDLIDRVERAQRASEGAWLTPADTEGSTLAARWPEASDGVLSFATDTLEPAAATELQEALGRAAPAAAALLRHTGRLLIRTLYAGDFAGSEALTHVDILMLMHRRLWAPRG